MIEDARGNIDCEISGNERGSTIVLVPGSCSTGAAWRPVIASLGDRFRCVTTSLPGYGRTAERRAPDAPDILQAAEIVRAVIRNSGDDAIHLVGHSFGGLVGLAAVLESPEQIASLTVIEAPAVELLTAAGELEAYRAFREMADTYFRAFHAGDKEAIAAMIDFYGGAGTYASWPERVRAYAIETTPVNMLDWACAFSFRLSPAVLEAINVPIHVIVGGASHPAILCANGLLSRCIAGASMTTIAGAAHFMISTHAVDVAQAIVTHVGGLSEARV
jgi:pimeloyl-ACP methyl ester carboxylesterase